MNLDTFDRIKSRNNMASQRLNKAPSDPTSLHAEIAVPIAPPKKVTERFPFKLFGKSFVVAIWLFSFFVLFNMDPVNRATDTLLRLDSFLRYTRAEDNEFENDVSNKYTNFKKSLDIIRISFNKTLLVIKESIPNPLEIAQEGFEEGCDFIGGLFGSSATNEVREVTSSEKYREP